MQGGHSTTRPQLHFLNNNKIASFADRNVWKEGDSADIQCPQGPQLSDGESNPLSLAWPVAQYALTTRLWGQRIIVIISDNEHSSLY